MAIANMTTNVAIHQTLADEPNAENGLSAQALKEKFDAGAVALKSYINGTLVPEVNRLGQNQTQGSQQAQQALSTAQEAQRTAQTAHTTAQNALSASQEALSTAQDALSAAQDAQTQAQGALHIVSGQLNLGGAQITGLADPSAGNDAVNMRYLDFRLEVLAEDLRQTLGVALDNISQLIGGEDA